MIRCSIPILAAAALSPGALAQFPTTTASTVTCSLMWDDVGPGSGAHNGEVQPGESVLLQLSISFSNQNTVGGFSPPVGGFSSGTILGFASAFIDLIGSGDAQGTWDVSPAHGYGVMPLWSLVGAPGNGTPSNTGEQLNQIQFGQFVASPGQVNATNPIVGIFSALWTPASYSPRLVTFQSQGDPGAGGFPTAILFDLDHSNIAWAYCPSEFGSAVINIGVPTPSGLALLGLAAGCGHRRRLSRERVTH